MDLFELIRLLLATGDTGGAVSESGRVRASVQNHERVIITVDAAFDIPSGLLKTWGEDVAEIIDDRIARNFSNERAAGKPLKGVTAEHDQRKAIDGLDLRKGHMYGDLQNALDSGGFWTVTTRRNRIDIVWDENALYSVVPHAEFYAEQKVRGGRILHVLNKDATAIRRYIEQRLDDVRMAA